MKAQIAFSPLPTRYPILFIEIFSVIEKEREISIKGRGEKERKRERRRISGAARAQIAFSPLPTRYPILILNIQCYRGRKRNKCERERGREGGRKRVKRRKIFGVVKAKIAFSPLPTRYPKLILKYSML